MSSSKQGGKSDSAVWELLNSLKSRNPSSPTMAQVVDKSLSKPNETRRAAVQEFCDAMDELISDGEMNGERLFNALTRRGRRGKAADVFVVDCSAKRVLDSRNSQRAMEMAVHSAKGRIAVATAALRKAQSETSDLERVLYRAELESNS